MVFVECTSVLIPGMDKHSAGSYRFADICGPIQGVLEEPNTDPLILVTVIDREPGQENAGYVGWCTALGEFGVDLGLGDSSNSYGVKAHDPAIQARHICNGVVCPKVLICKTT